jgi:serine/threonine protein kinase
MSTSSTTTTTTDFETKATEFGVPVAAIAEAELAKATLGFIGYAFRRGGPRLERYNFITELGKGGYGVVYSASKDGTRVPRFVVKEIRAKPIPPEKLSERRRRRAVAIAMGMGVEQTHDDYEFDTSYIERELRISKLIEGRLGREFCARHAICAQQRFFTPSHDRGYVVFPFFAANSLTTYLFTMIHNRMRQLQALRDAAPYEPHTIADFIQLYKAKQAGDVVDDLDSDESEELRSFVESMRGQMYAIQANLWQLVLQFVTAIGLLHSKLVFHRDIKTDNMLVGINDGQPSNDIRLIDFGVACAERIAGTNEQYDELYKQYLRCPTRNGISFYYADPLTRYISAKTIDEAIEHAAKADTYACGKVLQRMYDPASFEPNGEENRYPTVRETEFMPPGLYSLIIQMTGEIGYRPRVDKHDRIVLDAEQIAERRYVYAVRPSMAEVSLTLRNMFGVWNQSDVTRPLS